MYLSNKKGHSGRNSPVSDVVNDVLGRHSLTPQKYLSIPIILVRSDTIKRYSCVVNINAVFCLCTDVCAKIKITID